MGALTTINAATTALAVAWDDYLNDLNAGTKLKIIFCPGNINGVDLATGEIPRFGTANTGERLDRYVHTIKKSTDAVSNLYSINGLELGRVPLFWKVAAVTSESLAES